MEKTNVMAGIRLAGLVSIVLLQGCASSRAPSEYHWSDRIVMPKEVHSAPSPQMPPETGGMTAGTSRSSAGFEASDLPEIKPPVTLPSYKTYIVQKGDTLSAIARKHDVSLSEVVAINTLKNPNVLRVGQEIRLPEYARLQSAAPASASVSAAKTAPSLKAGEKYVVRSGDTLSGIASRSGVSVSDLKAVNGLKGDMIIVGQTLLLPQGAKAPAAAAVAAKKPAPAVKPETSVPAVKPAPAVAPAAAPAIEPVQPEAGEPEADEADRAVMEHIVYPGDTLEGLAETYATTVEELKALNNLEDPVELKSAQRLIVPVQE